MIPPFNFVTSIYLCCRFVIYFLKKHLQFLLPFFCMRENLRKTTEKCSIYVASWCKHLELLPFITDEERAIVNAISEVFPQAVHLRCWNHIFRDVTRWLRSHGTQSHDISVYLNDLRTLFHLQEEANYASSLDELKQKWSAPFFDFYIKNIHTDIHSIA